MKILLNAQRHSASLLAFVNLLINFFFFFFVERTAAQLVCTHQLIADKFEMQPESSRS